MLHILLIILKIIGIALAVIIGIFLAALICVLFIPVRYRVQADGKLGDEIPIRLEVQVTWLMHAINIAFSYSKSACLKIKLFCFTVFDSSRRKDSDKKKKKRTGPELENETGSAGKSTEYREMDGTAIEDKEKNRQKADCEGTDKKNEDSQEAGDTETAADADQTAVWEKSTDLEENGKEDDSDGKTAGSRIKTVLEAVRLFFRKLLEAVENIEYTIQKICGKIKGVMENIRYYVNILQGETFKGVFGNGKRQMLWILKRVMPKKCRINLTVGMEDPSGTGQIMAVYGMLYPFVGNSVSVQADFEEKIIEGDLFIKGRIRAVIFLIAGIKLLADKNTWKLIKLLKKEGA